MEDGGGVAPFVAKTYGMVSDPATDGVIGWGPENNSFVVVDPFAFSQSLLPAHFKHSNFSSFVRQLNTYGFRKVDPDRWEFAHASFLRGQTHLLSRIVRRNSSNTKGKSGAAAAAATEDTVVMEVVRLKREQRATEEEVRRMWGRVRDAERRPKQMLTFLARLLGDPEMLRRLMSRACADADEEKRSGTRLRLEGQGGPSAAPATVDVVEELGLATDSPLPFEDCEGFVGEDEVGPFFGVDGVDAFIPTVDTVGYDHYGGEMDGGGWMGVHPYPYAVKNEFE